MMKRLVVSSRGTLALVIACRDNKYLQARCAGRGRRTSRILFPTEHVCYAYALNSRDGDILRGAAELMLMLRSGTCMNH